MSTKARLPSYEPMLAAYHRAFSGELQAMVAALPIQAGQTVLDMACGDGVYGPWLAERVGPAGRVVSVDVRPEYLEVARRHTANSPFARNIEYRAASIESLPFEDDLFDLCWCAQSLYSLPDPVEALQHMRRVTKPGGVVAVLEGDTLHRLILPWPVDVELSVHAAALAAVRQKSDQPGKYYVGRQLRRVFRQAGLEQIESRTFATDRAAPLGQDDRAFFTEYLKSLSQRVATYLEAPIRGEFDRLVNPQSRDFLLDDPDLTATCIDQVVWGRKPFTNTTSCGSARASV
jgi:demethylmenaquinone methyltransferase / 2-methoxy-6-polyprenyl-1,4-benzoquinol methylase